MTVSALTDSTAIAAAGSPLPPLTVISGAVFLVAIVMALVILASYNLYDGPSFHEILKGWRRRRGATRANR